MKSKKTKPKTKKGLDTKQAAQQGPETRIPRAAKGKRPQYFEDPAVDKLHLMLMAVIEELSVARDRIDTLERLIETHGLFKRDEIESYFPDTTADAERTARRVAYIKRVMKGMTDEIEQMERNAIPLDFEEVVSIVSQ